MTKLSEADAANELMRLARNIRRHRWLFYDQDSPEITNREYDGLLRRNRDLEAQFPHLVRDDSPTSNISRRLTDEEKARLRQEKLRPQAIELARLIHEIQFHRHR